MKKEILKLGLIGVMTPFLFILFTACSYTDETATSTTEDSEIVSYAEYFATTHNECLDYCFEQLNTTTKASVTFASMNELNAEMVELAQSYVEAHTNLALKSNGQILTIDFINSATISDIRNRMSDSELFFIDKTLAESPNRKDVFEKIISEVITDKTLTTLQKKAVCSFITVYQKSTAYWDKNRQDWLTLKTNLVTHQITLRLAAWIAADCYWGWYGTVASGGNGIVGAGAAAVASGCMAMN